MNMETPAFCPQTLRRHLQHSLSPSEACAPTRPRLERGQPLPTFSSHLAPLHHPMWARRKYSWWLCKGLRSECLTFRCGGRLASWPAWDNIPPKSQGKNWARVWLITERSLVSPPHCMVFTLLCFRWPCICSYHVNILTQIILIRVISVTKRITHTKYAPDTVLNALYVVTNFHFKTKWSCE